MIRSPFEDEEIESLQGKVDEGSLGMGEKAPKTRSHHTLPSRTMLRVKLLSVQQKP